MASSLQGIEPSPPTAEGSRGRSLRWSTMAMLSLLLCSIAGAIVWGLLFAFNEVRAAQAVKVRLARLEAEGLPTDDTSLEAWFLNWASQEGTAAWHNVLSLTQSQPFPACPDDLNATPEELHPGCDWPAEPAVADYLKKMQPVIAQIELLAESPTPVWQPIQFNGYATLLGAINHVRTVSRMLALEAQHAVYLDDPQRAFNALASMELVSRAFDWQLCDVCELVHLALEKMHWETIQLTLRSRIWTETEVDGLIQQVCPPLNVAPRWQRTAAGERAMALSSMSSPKRMTSYLYDSEAWFSGLITLPSNQLAFLESVRRRERLGTLPLSELPRAASREEKRIRTGSISDFFVPALMGYASAFARHEEERRLTLTALAIKKFYLQHDTWPEQLCALETVGLSRTDYRKLQGRTFPFEIQQDHVIIWSDDPPVEDEEAWDSRRVTQVVIAHSP